MNTNISTHNLGTSAISPTAAGREARLDHVATSLEDHSLQVQSLDANELASYRAYGAQVETDIHAVQGYGATPAGQAYIDPLAAVDMILQNLQQQQSYLMMVMMMQYLMGMMQSLIEMMGGAPGGQPSGPVSPGDVVSPGEDSNPPDNVEQPEVPSDSDQSRKDDEMTPVRAARILSKYFDLLDTAAGKGKKDNVVEMADLAAVADNPDLPEELRRAAEYVVKNPAVAHALDIGNKVGEVDGRFGRKDFERFIAEHEGKEGYDIPVEANKPKAPERPPAEENRPPAENKPAEEQPSEEKPAEETPEVETPPEVERPAADEALKAQQDATALFEAMRGMGTNERRLISILSNRSNHQIALIKDAYLKTYDRDLVEHVKSETSGHFETVLVALLQGTRDESTEIDQNLVQNDAQAIREAGGTAGFFTDDEKLIAIFTSRSKAHMAEVSKVFEHIYGQSLRDFVEHQTSGYYEEVLLAQIP